MPNATAPQSGDLHTHIANAPSQTTLRSLALPCKRTVTALPGMSAT